MSKPCPECTSSPDEKHDDGCSRGFPHFEGCPQIGADPAAVCSCVPGEEGRASVPGILAELVARSGPMAALAPDLRAIALRSWAHILETKIGARSKRDQRWNKEGIAKLKAEHERELDKVAQETEIAESWVDAFVSTIPGNHGEESSANDPWSIAMVALREMMHPRARFASRAAQDIIEAIKRAIPSAGFETYPAEAIDALRDAWADLIRKRLHDASPNDKGEVEGRPIRIAFDVGGVLSAYPGLFGAVMGILERGGAEVYVMSDMGSRGKILNALHRNAIAIPEARVIAADYKAHASLCKAVACEEHEIDILIDDHLAYVASGAQVRLLLMPDSARPYYATDWKTDPEDGSFGRNVPTPRSGRADGSEA